MATVESGSQSAQQALEDCSGMKVAAARLSCQSHVLGDAVIPQRLRSIRKGRVRPASPDLLSRPPKRQCSSHQTEDAAIAEMLLDLSNSPVSSPRESEFSTEEELPLPLSPGRRRGSPVSRNSKRSSAHASDEELDEEFDDDVLSIASPKKGCKGARKVPGRCKCGKRVSASHPPCKSELMLLCERFRDRCGRLSSGGEPTRIHLNECAVALGVPRRRLYDITIVYEAVEVVKRTGKLAYVWRGLAQLPALIEQLKREEEVGQPVRDRKGAATLSQPAERPTTHSLWVLSRKFIRLLLTKKNPVQLTDAAEHLIGNQVKETKRQQTQITVERRLYDIGSILATLNLIQRTYVEGKRQPAFSWNWDWEQPAASQPPASQTDRPCSASRRSVPNLPRSSSALQQHGHSPGNRFQIPELSVQAFTVASRAASSEPFGSRSLQQLWSMPLAVDSRSLSGSGAVQMTLPYGSINFQHLGLPQPLPELGFRQHLQQELSLFSPALLPVSLSQQHGSAGVGCGLFSMPHHRNICKGVDQHA